MDPILEQYVNSSSSRDIIVGPVGSAKSSYAIRKLFKEHHRLGVMVNGKRLSRFWILRVDVKTLKDFANDVFKNVIMDVMSETGNYKYIPKIIGSDDIFCKIEFIDRKGTLNEMLVQFRSMNKHIENQIAGIRLTAFYVDELDQFDLELIKRLMSRTGRYIKTTGKIKMWATMNMPFRESEAYSYIYKLGKYKKDTSNILFQPPPIIKDGKEFYWNKEAKYLKRNGGFQPDEYYQNLLEINQSNEEILNRDILMIAPEYKQGSVFRKVFSLENHIAKTAISIIGKKCLIGIDNGAVNPAAIVIVLLEEEKLYYAVKEFTGQDLDKKEGAVGIAKYLKKFIEHNNLLVKLAFADGQGCWRASEVDGNTIADIYKEKAHLFLRKGIFTAERRIERIKEVLSLNKIIINRGGCPELCEALQGRYAYSKTGTLIKNSSTDIIDALGYALTNKIGLELDNFESPTINKDNKDINPKDSYNKSTGIQVPFGELSSTNIRRL